MSELTFEAAQKELEQIVERLETGQAPLDETISSGSAARSSMCSAAGNSTRRTAGSRS